jgi:hypothetical protein
VSLHIRLLLVGAAALAILILILLLLPPRPRASLAAPALPSGAPALAAPATARGAFHIHTNRSDGTGSVDEVASAAAQAGLQFIVLTDHGDGMRSPLTPSIRSGVLCLDGVEISTTGGHYVALDLPVAPYRLAGEPRDVVEDVRRLGGFGFAAHPDSPKTGLRWTGWDTAIDGVEWLNADTEWRDESRASLLRALTTYPWRPAETLGALLGHARTVLARWDEVARIRRLVGLAGVDAHARIGFRDGPDPYGGRVIAKMPSYGASFRTFVVHVELDAPLTADAARDGAAVVAALRNGHVYTTLDVLASPGSVGFDATSGGRRARMGDFLPPGGSVEWRALAAAPAGSTLRLVCDGKVAAEGPASLALEHRHEPGGLPAACRLEAGWDEDGRRVAWLVTNPIYLRASDPPPEPASTMPASVASGAPPNATSASVSPQVVSRVPAESATANTWAIERDPLSAGEWRWIDPTVEAAPSGPPAAVAPAAAAFTYRLRSGGRFSQYVAFVTQQVGPIAQATGIRFRASADRPMRLSVQVRRPLERPGEDERWQRSVYLDTTPRDIAVAFDDMRPVWPATAAHPPRQGLHALLFVVDTEHTPPGAAGTVRVEDLRLESRH